MAIKYERVVVMPTPTKDIEDKIVKYVGKTTEQYTYGKYYQCNALADAYCYIEGSSGTVAHEKQEIDARYCYLPIKLQVKNENAYSDIDCKNVYDTILETQYNADSMGGYIYLTKTVRSVRFWYNSYLSRIDQCAWQEVDVDERDDLKYFSRANVEYLLDQLADRMAHAHIGE